MPRWPQKGRQRGELQRSKPSSRRGRRSAHAAPFPSTLPFLAEPKVQSHHLAFCLFRKLEGSTAAARKTIQGARRACVDKTGKKRAETLPFFLSSGIKSPASLYEATWCFFFLSSWFLFGPDCRGYPASAASAAQEKLRYNFAAATGGGGGVRVPPLLLTRAWQLRKGFRFRTSEICT